VFFVEIRLKVPNTHRGWAAGFDGGLRICVEWDELLGAGAATTRSGLNASGGSRGKLLTPLCCRFNPGDLCAGPSGGLGNRCAPGRGRAYSARIGRRTRSRSGIDPHVQPYISQRSSTGGTRGEEFGIEGLLGFDLPRLNGRGAWFGTGAALFLTGHTYARTRRPLAVSVARILALSICRNPDLVLGPPIGGRYRDFDQT